MGAGDVKLMALCGAFLGPVHIVVAAVVTLVAGGVLGTVWLFFWRNSSGPDCLRNNTNSDSVNSAIPYALAITAGAVTSLIAAPAIVLTLGRGVS
jgi:prepilin peptidase CpaA